MSETNEKAEAKKVRATIAGTVITFPKTSFTLDMAAVFPTYSEMNAAQQYIVEYGFKQSFQDVTATPPKTGTPKDAQVARLAVLTKGNRPTKAAAIDQMTLFEQNAVTTAIRFKNVDMIDSMLHGTKSSPERIAEIKQTVLEALTAMAE